MLCGYEPFYGESEKELIEANKQAIIEFPPVDWSKISDEARDLVLKMTKDDPRERLSASDALQHPWFKRHDRNELDHSLTKGGRNTIHLSAEDHPDGGACVIS